MDFLFKGAGGFEAIIPPVACGDQKSAPSLFNSSTTIMGLNRDEILEQFEEFRRDIDEQNDKRERLIKASQATPFSLEADVRGWLAFARNHDTIEARNICPPSGCQ